MAFFSHAKICGEGLTNHFSLVLFFFFFFPEQTSAHAHLFHSLGLDQSTVAQRSEMTMEERSLKCSKTLPGRRSQPTLEVSGLTAFSVN